VIAQGAEETLTGARAMLEDGMYQGSDARPDVVLAQHSAPLPAGYLAHAQGPVLAASQAIRVTVHGEGGHAGSPQFSVDPIIAAAAIVGRLQAIVSRETGPAEPVVVAVGSVHAGVSSNIIAEEATLEISVRTMSETSLRRVSEAVRRVVHAECLASGCRRTPTIDVIARSPVTETDTLLGRQIRERHSRAFGPRRVIDWLPAMATDDVGLFGPAGQAVHGHADVKLAYWILGTSSVRQWRSTPGDTIDRLTAQPPNHSPFFAPDVRNALPTGIRAMALAARSQLSGPTAEQP
jgi:hippurate hydrolase